MLKRVQIEILEERIRELEGETQRLMIENEVLNDRIDKAIEYIENDLQISILPNNQIINGTEVVKRINKIENLLKGEE